MATVTVPALMDFEHGGQMFRRGESVTLPAVFLAALAREGKVSIVQGYQVAVVTPRGRQARRRYRRRDLTAEA